MKSTMKWKKWKSILKWITGIIYVCSLILLFFIPNITLLTLILGSLYCFLELSISEQLGNLTSLPKTYQLIFQNIFLLIFSGLIWLNLAHGDMILVVAMVVSWLTAVCELWLLHSKNKVSNS